MPILQVWLLTYRIEVAHSRHPDSKRLSFPTWTPSFLYYRTFGDSL